MSRGFVKEEDQEEIPLVPPRANLPKGVTNYVTQVGMDKLQAEKQSLNDEKANLDTTSESEKRIASNHIKAKLQLLNDRIAEARIVNLADQPQDEVRFGASVSLKIGSAKGLQTYQIVGVDEADIAEGKISFTSPIAKLLINKKVGDKAILELKNEDRVFEIMKISYG
ncbi:MAG: GreA/GreB family elongation factor [Cyclobacteriaceae bacterium]